MDKTLQTTVWNCLPKEFKEEVKKIYSSWTNPMAVGFESHIITCEYIFGKHNLTSDAEEEEMLYVSRKRVQELYNKFEHAFDNVVSDNLMGHYRAKIGLLKALFGSKCLPDAPSSAPSTKLNALSSVGNEDDFTSKEPTDLDEESSTCTNDCPSQCPSLGKETSKMKPIESKVSVYIATKEEDEEFRLLLHKNGFKWKSGISLISDSCWASGSEENKIHYVYPHKIVAYYGDKTSETLTFTEFKKRYFSEDVNLSQETANCDKQFDNILKDSFSKERRLNIATNVLEALIKSQYYSLSPDCQEENISEMAEVSVRLADALIAECEKGGNNA